MMTRPKIGAQAKGRPKGKPNQTGGVKEGLSLAFKGIGGVKELERWGKKNPGEFYKLWAKMLSIDVELTGNAGEPLRVIFSHE